MVVLVNSLIRLYKRLDLPFSPFQRINCPFLNPATILLPIISTDSISPSVMYSFSPITIKSRVNYSEW